MNLQFSDIQLHIADSKINIKHTKDLHFEFSYCHE